MTYVVTVKSQTLGKVTQCLFSLSKPIRLPSSPCIPKSLRLQGPGFHTLLPTLNLPAQGPWLHFPYKTQPLWFSKPPPPLFLYLRPLGCCSLLSSLPPLPLSPYDAAQLLSTLDSHRFLFLWLCSPFYQQ